MNSGKPNQSSGHQRPPLPPTTFPPHLPPLYSAFHRPPLNRHDTFHGQYAMPSHPPPPQNRLSQPQPLYYGYHPPDYNPYSSPRYLYLSRNQSLPFVQSPEGVHPSYHQQRLPLAAESSPGTYVQYLPPVYSATGHFGLPQQQQPSAYQWYYSGSQGSSTDSPSQGTPPQIQQRHSSNFPRQHGQWTRRGLGAHSARSTSLSSSGADSSSIAAMTLPTTAEPSGQSHQQSPSKSDTQVSSPSRARGQPILRRHYHPNPPPNRSEWVMWVGNVPSDATEDELRRFLSHIAPPSSSSDAGSGVDDRGILSVFLISRSNSAFVNYRSEEQLNHAIPQCNGRKLRPHDRRCPRLVCRARRKEDDLRAGVGGQRGMGIHTRHVKEKLHKEQPTTAVTPSPKDEEISKSGTVDGAKVTTSPSSYASTSSSFLMRHFPKRFFILKSLTQYDLDLSVERGAWATQKHNEVILDQAFRTSKEVILIFSANKSGEFFGYARMMSGILYDAHSISWAPRTDPFLIPPLSSPGSVSVQERHQGSSGQVHGSPYDRRLIQTYPLPSGPSPITPEDGERASGPLRAKTAEERRRSAPSTLDGDCKEPLRPSLSSSRGHSGEARQVTSQGPHGHPPTLRPELGPSPGARAGPRSKGVPVGTLGPQLRPVAEERDTGSVVVVENDSPQASPPAQSPTKHERSEVQRETSWGQAFQIEWLCTQRVPFRRTRHLHNPWNHNREVKVSRDGTELEPTVGERLVEEWPTLADGGSNDGARHNARSADPPEVRS